MNTFTNAHNPILPLEYHIPDGEAHVMPDGKLYIYGSYDKLEDFYCSGEYHVVSTPDMLTWTVHDTALRAEDIPWFHNPDAPHYPGVDWTKPTRFVREKMPELLAEIAKPPAERWNGIELPALLYAPDCIYKDGKYYLYFCMSDESEGVAVSSSPVGPFVDPVLLPCGEIDPAVFLDDNGDAYLYWGQFRSRGVMLNGDMVSFDESRIVPNLVTEEEHFFHEGSSMRKIGDTYYYIFADMERGKPTSLGYATGKSPLGPFTYRGIIIDNAACDPASWNNHGSIECFKGQWYVFYHRSSRGGQMHRRLCIEPINILPDGSIPEVKMTSQGPGKPFASGEAIYGYQACEVHGALFIAPDGAGSEVLCHIADGDSAVFRYVQGETSFLTAVFESTGQGHVTVLLDGTVVAEAILSRDGKTTVSLADCQTPTKARELILRFSAPRNLSLRAITLFA